MEDVIVAILIILIILVFVFIITRAFWLWYWRVNTIVDNLELINHNLEEIKTLLINQNSMSSKTNRSNEKDKLPEL